MHHDWIVHDSHSLCFRSPFGAVPVNTPIVLRLAIRSPGRMDAVILRLWREGHGEEKIPMNLEQDEAGKRVYAANIVAPAVPGLLWYYFIVHYHGKMYYYGNNAQGLGGIGQIWEHAPPSYQVTVFRQGASTPHWLKEAVMYQIFVDRFFNGDPAGKILNPKKGSLIHAHWDDTPFYVRDTRTGKIMAYDFFGGNLRGVIAKLSYLKELGVNVIYLNPVFESPSNHKYDTSDYKTIDPMFGDNDTFQLLCAQAAELGISVILDGVFSHTGSDSIYFNKEERYPGPGAYQSRQSPYYPWYRFIEYPHRYESWWGIDTLPNVNELEPSYMDFIIDGDDSVLKYWMRMGARGWRLDVADELPDAFVKRFYKVMKEVDAESVLIGEVWEDASHKTSYGTMREYLLGEELDAVTNYPFRSILLDFVLGNKDACETHWALMSLYENYPRHHFYSCMNILGSHDVPRILTLLGEAPPAEILPAGEQAQYRLSPAQRKLAIARLKLLSLWQMTFPGAPCIYYGDEAGMEGYSDPFNRGTYPWGREERELVAWYKQIAALRNEYDVLKTGEWVPLYMRGDVYGYLRVITGGQDVFGHPKRDNVAVLLFNRGEGEARLTVDVGPRCQGALTDVLEGGREIPVQDGKLCVTVPPLTGKLLLHRVEKPVFPREAGLLLHPTSLPSPYGIGDVGPEAYAFVDFLKESKIGLWQILPLNPPGLGESPYSGLSAFAGNPLLISIDGLLAQGLLTTEDIRPCPSFPDERVEFAAVREYKERLFRKAFLAFKKQQKPPDYAVFVADNRLWLENYALFMALKTHFAGRPWNRWVSAIASRDPEALAYYREMLAEDVDYHIFLQYTFFAQWQALKQYANNNNVKIVGDLPLFVAYDSSDVWANPCFFALDEKGEPVKVAGVPPDYFSATGQLWGNPHYQWEEMAKDDYRWWRERFQTLLKLADIIRIDHFRGFEAYWEIPAGETTALRGQWVKGPGETFFATIKKYLGDIPVIAEDLGVITPEVETLKQHFHFPGMKVLQFAFAKGADGQWVTHQYGKNTVVYTGTHDNDTLWGWYSKALAREPEVIAHVKRLLGLKPEMDRRDICWRFIEFAFRNNANTVIIPLQDVLCLGSEARMNHPGTVDGNWRWRCLPGSFSPELAKKLAAVVLKYGRAVKL